MSDRLLIQLEELEGRRAAVYQDTEGWWTIGVGCLVDSRNGGGLLPEEIDFIRDNRIRLAKNEAAANFPGYGGLNEPRQAVIILMLYQLGLPKLALFRRFLAAVRDERWSVAKSEMLDSLWARQTPNRARRLAYQMETGEWQ